MSARALRITPKQALRGGRDLIAYCRENGIDVDVSVEGFGRVRIDIAISLDGNLAWEHWDSGSNPDDVLCKALSDVYWMYWLEAPTPDWDESEWRLRNVTGCLVELMDDDGEIRL